MATAMAQYLPVRLEGDTLGQRHCYLNSMVNKVYKEHVSFNEIQGIPEKSPIDRIFKIELASKYKNVDYMIENFKHPDMLYVSKAMKMWLLEPQYAHIINPKYLEDTLYPEMTTTAVTKLKKMIQLNLRDDLRCEEFYYYYKEKNFDIAVKFLYNCSKELILSESHIIWDKLTPFRLKLLSEKVPKVATIFYDHLYNKEENFDVADKYISNMYKYYKNIKFLLKVDGNIFLDIIEKSFAMDQFKRLSSEATKFVMKNYKIRFQNKPELYTAHLLDIETLSRCLDVLEIKELIVKLAQAEYLSNWFNYKNVEPLLNKIEPAQRSVLKKQVFVEKLYEGETKKWPYEIPSLPDIIVKEKTIFDDMQCRPSEYDFERPTLRSRMMLKRKYCKYSENCEMMYLSDACMIKRKTSLDELFDRYRFMGFEKTFFDLKKQLRVETAKHRQNIMLVLISKTGGKTESVEQLLNLISSSYDNEPENLRATVIRSLVKRCNAWRLPDNVWEMVLSYGRGLGLDGRPSDVPCIEGLHAVIIRNILNGNDFGDAIWGAYLKDFSTLKEYSLSGKEQSTIISTLPQLLMNFAKKDPTKTKETLEKTLQLLEAYKIKVQSYPELIELIATEAKVNKQAENLLRHLFDAKIARKKLIKENFSMIQNNASYLNALRHDPELVKTGEKFEKIIKCNELAHDRFLKYLALYYNEENGLAQSYLDLLMKPTEGWPKNRVARSVAILAGEKIVDIMRNYNDAPKKSKERIFGAMLKANSHLSRPAMELSAQDWRYLGVKAVATRLLTCPTKDIDKNIETLIKCNRTQKLAFILAMRVGKETNVAQLMAEKFPRKTLKTALKHFKRNQLDESIWDVIIPAIPKINFSDKCNERLRIVLNKSIEDKVVPAHETARFCSIAYDALSNASAKTMQSHMPMLCNIENCLHEIDSNFIENVIARFLKDELTSKVIMEFYSKNSKSMGYSPMQQFDKCNYLRIRIIAKHLLLCKTEEEQKRRWEKIGKPFLDWLEDIWNKITPKADIYSYIEEFVNSLKVTKVFLDTEYVSCLPILELITIRMQKFLPHQEVFEIYVFLHLNMLYFKTIRQAKKMNPETFDDLPKNLDLATEIVGRMFGKYIAREVAELSQKYFDSVRIAYREELLKYIDNNFMSGSSIRIFTKNIITGIIESEFVKSHIVAVILFQRNQYWTETHEKEITDLINNSAGDEVKFFLNCRCRL